MAIHAEASDLLTATTELGITQRRVAELFGVTPRSVRRWQNGERHIPCGVSMVVKLLAMGVVTVTQIERAAVPARTNGTNGNGSAKPGPPAPLIKLAPEPRAEAATVTDLDLTTAAKIFALTADACRWPLGDPQRPGFRFCGEPAICRPYCQRHRRMAYLPIDRRSSAPFRLSTRTISPARKLTAVV